VVSTLPASGSGSFQNFALTVTDGSGPSNIAAAYFMVNTSISAANSCFVSYSRGSNTLYLMNDAGTTFQGPITLGTSGTLSNSQCTLSAAAASVSTSGNTLTVNLPLSFAFAFSGAKSTFGIAQDNSAQYSPWATTGTWTVPAFAPPAVVSTLPSSGSGSSQTFSLTVTDGGGASNIAAVYFMVNASISAANSCFVAYNRGSNTLYLMNDAGTTFLGPLTPGTATSVSNTRCTLSAASASVSTSGTTLTVNLPLSFFNAFSGAKNTFGLALDNSSQYSAWTTTGTWTVP
jgi:hypothetical protein